MKATFKSKEKNDVTFTVEFTAEDFDQALNGAYLTNRHKYAVDGFRKGKAPRGLIERHYGEDVFFEDAVNQMFYIEYPKSIEALGLDPIDRPKVDFGETPMEKGKGFSVEVTVTVKPEFEVKDYKGVKLEKIQHTVSDEDVDAEIGALQKRNARMILVERPAKDGDTLLIDYTGFVDDVQFEGGTAERQSLKLGSNTFIPGFEEQLIGAGVNEEKDVKVTFPEEYHAAELAGKEAIFKVKVHEIKEEELPEATDEFAKDVSEFDSIEELRSDTREKLEKTAAERSEFETKNKVLEKVYDANEIDIPDVMIEDQIDQMMQEFDQQLRYQGMDLSMYSKYLKKEMKEIRQEFRADAEKKVKTRLVVEAVAEAEKMEASQEEIDKEMQDMAEQYKMELNQVQEVMQGENLGFMKQDIKMRKAIDFMFENADIV